MQEKRVLYGYLTEVSDLDKLPIKRKVKKCKIVMKKIVEMIPTPSEDLESIMPPKNYLWTRNNMQNYGEHNTFAKNSWPIYICRYTANNCVETFQTLATFSKPSC